MGRAADGKVGGGIPGTPEYGNPRASAIKHDIERTRDEMQDTVDAIETRLSPARIKAQISHVKEHAVGQFLDAKNQVKDEIVHGIDEAKDRFVHGIDDARDKVKSEIGGARAAMREATVGKVEHMVERAGTQVKDVGTSFVDTVKTNPVPAAFIGFGLAWLLVSARKQSSDGGGSHRRFGRRFDGERSFDARRVSSYGRTYDAYGSSYGGGYDEQGERLEGAGYGADYEDEEGVRDTRDNRSAGVVSEGRDFAHRAGSKVSGAAEDLVENARDKFGNVRDAAGRYVEGARDVAGRYAGEARDVAGRLAHDARDRAGHWVEEGRSTVIRAERGIEHVFEDNPLAIGAVAFAVGAAVGLALPTTTVEDRVFGQAKDRLLESAEGAARGALKTAEEKATQALHGGEEMKKDKGNDKFGGASRRV
jgi:hypothetical protein